MIRWKVPYLKFDNLEIFKDDINKSGIVIEINNVKKITSNQILLDIPNCIKIISKICNINEENSNSLLNEGCFFYNDTCEIIIESICYMETFDGESKNTFSIRIPLSSPDITDRLYFCFDGTWLFFTNEQGKVLNENSGLDKLCLPQGEKIVKNNIKLYTAKINKYYIDFKDSKNYYLISPYHYNAFAGDVMNFYHNGIYHLMFLLDRRHHGSRAGKGAHYISHFTTKNFIDWEEQKPIEEIDAPYKAFGTGTMFYQDGKYYMTYGLHTERYDGKQPKISAIYNDEDESFIKTDYKSIFDQYGLPVGATYAVSEDGLNFTPSNVIFHTCRNPSCYYDGKEITLYSGYGADGVWKAKSFDENFQKCDTTFDFIDPVMKNTTECPCFFSWNGYSYLIIGFSGYFRTTKENLNKYIPAWKLNENIYDGLCVPMVSEYKDNRRIISGWLNGIGWGSVVAHRELIQDKNGSLGTKWLSELVPTMHNANSLCKENNIISKRDYMIRVDITKNNSNVFAIQFCDDKDCCNFQINFSECSSQFSNAELNTVSKKIDTMYEQLKNDKDTKPVFHRSGKLNIPIGSVDYSVPLRQLNDNFTIKIMSIYVKKINSTVLDVEIDGRQTMISVRKSFYPTRIKVLNMDSSEISGLIGEI